MSDESDEDYASQAREDVFRMPVCAWEDSSRILREIPFTALLPAHLYMFCACARERRRKKAAAGAAPKDSTSNRQQGKKWFPFRV